MKAIGSGRFLSFELDGNQYAIEVERVEVVLETVPITRVPQAATHLKGVINYRGAVIPVADLRSRFAMEALADEGPRAAELPPADGGALSSGSSIIVLHVNYGGENIVMGVLADAVREVVDIDASHIEKAPGIGGRGGSELVAGVGEKNGHFVVILNIDAAFETEEAYLLPSAETGEGGRTGSYESARGRARTEGAAR